MRVTQEQVTKIRGLAKSLYHKPHRFTVDAEKWVENLKKHVNLYSPRNQHMKLLVDEYDWEKKGGSSDAYKGQMSIKA